MPRSYRARIIDHLHEARRSIAMEKEEGIADGFLREQALTKIRLIIDDMSWPPPGTPPLDTSTVDTTILDR